MEEKCAHFNRFRIDFDKWDKLVKDKVAISSKSTATLSVNPLEKMKKRNGTNYFLVNV